MQRLVNYIVVLAVFAGIWLPELAHYHVPAVNITKNEVEKLRHNPKDVVLKELAQMDLLSSFVDDEALVATAKDILHGHINLPGFPEARIVLPFDASQLEQGSPLWQLLFASFIAPDALLRAYELTGDEQYFLTAKEIILAWAEYEESTWLPNGFLWNDHAISARISVLSTYWRLYRKHATFDHTDAREVLGFIGRSAKRLAKKSHFTFSTNHGIMQNLALLHICVAFPDMPDVDRYKTIALQRLREQLRFYVNDEGVVLEHSAGYHSMGVRLLAMALRYMTLLGESIPRDWITKYRKARDFFEILRRPDGSLPLLGDTSSDDYRLGSFVTEVTQSGIAAPLRRVSLRNKPYPEWSLFPVAGYSVWWNNPKDELNDAAQTLIAWSYFPGHGHQFADEMSVFLWASGTNWLTNVGYWPYGMAGRSDAVSWNGSNAPHLMGEPFDSDRNTTLVSYGHLPGNKLKYIELRRTTANGFRPTRQVLQITADVWVVLDSFEDGESRTGTHTWLTYPEVSVQKTNTHAGFVLRARQATKKMFCLFLNGKGVSLEQVRGKTNPYVGWVVSETNQPKKAHGFKMIYPTNKSWSLAMWALADKNETRFLASEPQMIEWKDSGTWEIQLPLQGRSLRIKREENELLILQQQNRHARDMRLGLAPGPEVGKERRIIKKYFDYSANKYEKHRDLISYRYRISYLLLIVFIAQESTFFAFRRSKTKYQSSLRLMSTFAWTAGGIWLGMIYFA